MEGRVKVFSLTLRLACSIFSNRDIASFPHKQPISYAI